MIRTTLADKPEQFVTGNGEYHVGRRVLAPDEVYSELSLVEVRHDVFDDDVWVDRVLFQLDFDAGLVFVDPSQLRPYPSEPIEEPGK